MYLMKDVIREGDPRLKTPCTEVKMPINGEDLLVLRNLMEYVVASGIDKMVEQYKIRPGVGIAAPQVGVCKRMFAISFDDFLNNNKHYAMAVINPVITWRSKEQTYLPGGEGCLSVDRNTDGLLTPRNYKITFKAWLYDFRTNTCKPKTMTLEGYPAIVFQHEYDHLDGIMYVDKMYPSLDLEPLYTVGDDSEE